jgi:hypothetical protein
MGRATVLSGCRVTKIFKSVNILVTLHSNFLAFAGQFLFIHKIRAIHPKSDIIQGYITNGSISALFQKPLQINSVWVVFWDNDRGFRWLLASSQTA